MDEGWIEDERAGFFRVAKGCAILFFDDGVMLVETP